MNYQLGEYPLSLQMSLKKSDIDWYLLLTSNLGLSEADLISLLKGRPEFQESMDDISEDNRKHIETLKKRFDLTS